MFANRFNLFLIIFTIIIIKQIQCIPTKRSDLIIDEHHRSVRSIENVNDKDNKLNGKPDDSDDDDDDDDNKEKNGKLNQAQKFQRHRHKQLELLSD
jgi:hypothetical protein